MSENLFDLSEEEIRRLEARAESLVAEHEKLRRELIALRTKGGLSQADVAERMNVSQPRVAEVERYDGNPTLSTIRRYANAVGARILHTIIDDSGSRATVSSMWSDEAVDSVIRKTEEVLRGLPINVRATSSHKGHEFVDEWVPSVSKPLVVKSVSQ